jgi:hypothetical protein
MKIDFEKEMKDNTDVSHLIISCLTATLKGKDFDEFVSKYHKEKTIDIKLTVNDIELSIKDFIEHWQSQVEEKIESVAKEKVKEIIGDRFTIVSDLLYDLEKQVKKNIIPDLVEE